MASYIPCHNTRIHSPTVQSGSAQCSVPSICVISISIIRINTYLSGCWCPIPEEEPKPKKPEVESPCCCCCQCCPGQCHCKGCDYPDGWQCGCGCRNEYGHDYKCNTCCHQSGTYPWYSFDSFPCYHDACQCCVCGKRGPGTNKCKGKGKSAFVIGRRNRLTKKLYG